MRTGKVTFWKRSYGFIRDDEMQDQFFVHVNEVTHDAGVLHKDQRVSFDIAPSPNSGRPQAVNVVPRD
jgi:cold shock CspA family protein